MHVLNRADPRLIRQLAEDAARCWIDKHSQKLLTPSHIGQRRRPCGRRCLDARDPIAWKRLSDTFENRGGVRGFARCRGEQMRERRALQIDSEDERASAQADDDDVQTGRNAGPEMNLEQGLSQKPSSVRQNGRTR